MDQSGDAEPLSQGRQLDLEVVATGGLDQLQPGLVENGLQAQCLDRDTELDRQPDVRLQVEGDDLSGVGGLPLVLLRGVQHHPALGECVSHLLRAGRLVPVAVQDHTPGAGVDQGDDVAEYQIDVGRVHPVRAEIGVQLVDRPVQLGVEFAAAAVSSGLVLPLLQLLQLRVELPVHRLQLVRGVEHVGANVSVEIPDSVRRRQPVVWVRGDRQQVPLQHLHGAPALGEHEPHVLFQRHELVVLVERLDVLEADRAHLGELIVGGPVRHRGTVHVHPVVDAVGSGEPLVLTLRDQLLRQRLQFLASAVGGKDNVGPVSHQGRDHSGHAVSVVDVEAVEVHHRQVVRSHPRRLRLPGPHQALDPVDHADLRRRGRTLRHHMVVDVRESGVPVPCPLMGFVQRGRQRKVLEVGRAVLVRQAQFGQRLGSCTGVQLPQPRGDGLLCSGLPVGVGQLSITDAGDVHLHLRLEREVTRRLPQLVVVEELEAAELPHHHATVLLAGEHRHLVLLEQAGEATAMGLGVLTGPGLDGRPITRQHLSRVAPDRPVIRRSVQLAKPVVGDHHELGRRVERRVVRGCVALQLTHLLERKRLQLAVDDLLHREAHLPTLHLGVELRRVVALALAESVGLHELHRHRASGRSDVVTPAGTSGLRLIVTHQRRVSDGGRQLLLGLECLGRGALVRAADSKVLRGRQRREGVVALSDDSLEEQVVRHRRRSVIRMEELDLDVHVRRVDAEVLGDRTGGQHEAAPVDRAVAGLSSHLRPGEREHRVLQQVQVRGRGHVRTPHARAHRAGEPAIQQDRRSLGYLPAGSGHLNVRLDLEVLPCELDGGQHVLARNVVGAS